MNFVDKLRRFMNFIYDKYEADNTFRSYGEYPWTLIEESSIDFGDARAQLAAMDILLHHGLIEVVNCGRPEHIKSYYKIRPSFKALVSARSDQQRVWRDIISAVAEGITRGIIKS